MTANEQLNEMSERVYGELRKLAHYIRAMPARPRFQTTSLVHEAYLRLADTDLVFKNKQHFMRIASTAMRRLLVDQQRRERAAKRGGAAQQVPLAGSGASHDPLDVDLLDLDEALDDLTKVDPRKCAVVELCYFGGCTLEETAENLGISTTSVHRELELAKAWLYDRLKNSK